MRPVIVRAEEARGGAAAEGPPVSVILIAYNEAATIEAEIRAFHAAIVARLPGSELIVAEDGSTDGTTQIIQKLVAELGIVHVGSAERRGYARALMDAVRACKSPLVFFSDTGLKHDPREFWALYAERDALDLVVGRKTGRTDQWYRRVLTAGYNFFLRLVFGVPGIHDADSGFRLFNRAVVEQVFAPGLEFKSLIGSEVVLRTVQRGLKYGEVPVSYRPRAGESRGMPVRSIFRQAFRAVRGVLRIRREWARSSR